MLLRFKPAIRPMSGLRKTLIPLLDTRMRSRVNSATIISKPGSRISQYRRSEACGSGHVRTSILTAIHSREHFHAPVIPPIQVNTEGFFKMIQPSKPGRSTWVRPLCISPCINSMCNWKACLSPSQTSIQCQFMLKRST